MVKILKHSNIFLNFDHRHQHRQSGRVNHRETGQVARLYSYCKCNSLDSMFDKALYTLHVDPLAKIKL